MKLHNEAIKSAAKEIHGDLLRGVIGSGISISNYLSVLMSDYKIEQSNKDQLVAEVKKFGYSGSLLD